MSSLMLPDSCAFCADMEVRTALIGRAPKTADTVRARLEMSTGNQEESRP